MSNDSNDSPRNPKAGLIQEMIKSPTFGEYLVPAAEDAPEGVYPADLGEGDEEVVAHVPTTDEVARAESRAVVEEPVRKEKGHTHVTRARGKKT